MDRANADHLAAILADQAQAIRAKYERGQAEHGGQMWRKAGMLAQAEAEQYDLAVYLATLRGQLRHAAACVRRDPEQARAILLAILAPGIDDESDVFPLEP